MRRLKILHVAALLRPENESKHGFVPSGRPQRNPCLSLSTSAAGCGAAEESEEIRDGLYVRLNTRDSWMELNCY